MNQVESLLREQYLQNGFSLMKNVFDVEACKYFKFNLKEILKENTKKGNGVKVWAATEMPEKLKDLVYNPKIVTEVKGVLNSSSLEFLSCKVVFKSAEIQYESPWHQDRMYWGGCEKISTWVALDDTSPNNGCLRVIPKTHKSEVEHIRIDSDSFQNRIQNQNLADEMDVIMRAGDVLLFSDLLIHGSHKNISGQDRYSVIATYRVANSHDSSKVNQTLWKNPVMI